MPRPPSIVWYYKQWLGDNNVLAMDWDAKAMHFHLLMMSIQEEPPGSIPTDMGVIRRWLSLPRTSEGDRVWARVQPQIFTAWSQRDKRWFNGGMVETMERKQRYSVRYEIGTKSERKTVETPCNCNNSFSSKEEKENSKAVPSESAPVPMTHWEHPFPETPEDQPARNLALGLIERLQLVDTGYMLKVVEKALKTATSRQDCTSAQAFDYLFATALKARERGAEINNFWFGNADGWEPKEPKPPKTRKREPPPPDGVALKRAQLQAARERGEIE